MKMFYALPICAMFFPVNVLPADTESQRMFQTLDKNSDGYVTVIEATGQMNILKKWTDADINVDGVLEMSEFSAFEVAETYVPSVNSDDHEIGAEISH